MPKKNEKEKSVRYLLMLMIITLAFGLINMGLVIKSSGMVTYSPESNLKKNSENTTINQQIASSSNTEEEQENLGSQSEDNSYYEESYTNSRSLSSQTTNSSTQTNYITGNNPSIEQPSQNTNSTTIIQNQTSSETIGGEVNVTINIGVGVVQ